MLATFPRLSRLPVNRHTEYLLGSCSQACSYIRPYHTVTLARGPPKVAVVRSVGRHFSWFLENYSTKAISLYVSASRFSRRWPVIAETVMDESAANTSGTFMQYSAGLSNAKGSVRRSNTGLHGAELTTWIRLDLGLCNARHYARRFLAPGGRQ